MTYHKEETALLDFYLDTSDYSIEEIKQELSSTGIEPKAETDYFKYLIKKKEAEFKIRNGKSLQESFDSIFFATPLYVIRNILQSKKDENPKVQFAFNKLESIDEENVSDLLDDEVKLLLLKELEKQR